MIENRGGMFDLNEEQIQIVISHDRKTVWVNTAKRCVLRASNVPVIIMDDDREK